MSDDQNQQPDHLVEDDLPVEQEVQPAVKAEESVQQPVAGSGDQDETEFDRLYVGWPQDHENVFPNMGDTHSEPRSVKLDNLTDDEIEDLSGIVTIPAMYRELHAEQLRVQLVEGVDESRRHVTVKSTIGAPRHGDVVKTEDGIYRATTAYKRSARRQNAHWQQLVEHNNNKLTISKPKFSDNGDQLVGERAVTAMRSLMGFAETVRVPLWHSGVWVTIRGPSDRDLIALITQMRRDVTTLGRTTTGAALSNQIVMHVDTLIMFLRHYIIETSYYSIDDVLNVIKAQDFDMLLAGLAASIYTRGFEFVRVVGDRGENGEFNIVRARLNIPKCMWTDNSMLTDRQRNHMTLRASGSMTKQAVEEYQKGFKTISSHIYTYTLSTGREVKIELAPPFLHEYIAEGHAWVSELQELVTRTLGVEAQEELRNREIAKLARSTYLRLYSHWVVGIEVEGRSTRDREKGALTKLLDELSSDNNVMKQFPIDVGNYIDDTTVSMLATTALTDAEAATHKRFPQLVPINALATFFQLLSQKARRVDPSLITSDAVL